MSVSIKFFEINVAVVFHLLNIAKFLPTNPIHPSMTILNRPIHRTPSFKQGALALLAAAALSVGSSSAFAGASELKALQAALPPGIPISLANSAELLSAFTAVIQQQKFSSLKEQAIVAGEALKSAGINAPDAGEVFGTAIVAAALDPAVNPLDAIAGDRTNFTALASKTAGTGKGLNVLQIPGLSATLLSAANFIPSAQNAKNSAGAGAILGGRAQQLVVENSATAGVQSVVLANSALADKSLQKAAQDIVRYISAEIAGVSNTADFTNSVGNGNAGANNKYAVQIATGGAAGDPTNAGNIAHAIFGQQLLNSNGTQSNAAVPPSAGLKSAAIKGLSKLVKNMASFADIEEAQKIGNAIGQEIKNGSVKLSQAAMTAKVLAQAVMNKPTTNSFGQSIARNSASNKQDELVEVAAYLIGGLSGSAELNGLSTTAAANKLFSIITTVAKTKINPTFGGPPSTGFTADLTGSVALTVLNAANISAGIKQSFRDLLLNTSTAAKIDKNNVSAIQSIVGAVYGTIPNPAAVALLENGSNLNGAVSDPETDFRPFNNPPGGQS